MEEKERLTPTKEQILERARELWFEDRLRREGAQALELNPEVEELREEGFLLIAQQQLMTSETRKHSEWLELERIKNELPLETEALIFNIEEAMRSGIFVSGTSGSGKTNLCFHLAERLTQHGIIVFVLDPSQAWQKDSSIKQVITVPQVNKPIQVNWNPESTIFDISLLYVKNQRKFAELFCRTIFDKAVHGYKPKVFVMFEDAQLYLPNHGLRANVYQEVMRLVTTGRNFNIRYGLLTQFPSMVDKTCVKMTKQRYFGWTNEKNDIAYLRAFLGDKTSELETLEVGQFLYDYGKTTKKISVPKFEAKREATTNLQYMNSITYQWR